VAICEAHPAQTGDCRSLISKQLAEAMTAAQDVREAPPRPCTERTPPPATPYETILTPVDVPRPGWTHPLEPGLATSPPAGVPSPALRLLSYSASKVQRQAQDMRERRALPPPAALSNGHWSPMPCETPEAAPRRRHLPKHVVAHVARIPTRCSPPAMEADVITREEIEDCGAATAAMDRLASTHPAMEDHSSTPISIPSCISAELASAEQQHVQELTTADASHIAAPELSPPVPSGNALAGAGGKLPSSVYDSVSSPPLRVASTRREKQEAEAEADASAALSSQEGVHDAARRTVLSPDVSPELREAAFGVLKTQVAHDKALAQFQRLMSRERPPR